MLTDEQMASFHRHFAQVPDPRQALPAGRSAGDRGCRPPSRLPAPHRNLRLRPRSQAGPVARLRLPSTAPDWSLARPTISTLHYIFKALDAEVVERELTAWAAEQAPPNEPLAANGRYLRKSYDRDRGDGDTVRDEPAERQLLLVGLHSRLVVAQRGCSGRKDEAEGAVLRRQLERWRNTGRHVIADALHTQREPVQRLRELNLGFVLTAKVNHPPCCSTCGQRSPARARVPRSELGHGRIECRRI